MELQRASQGETVLLYLIGIFDIKNTNLKLYPCGFGCGKF